jgi:hypothetical protein
MARAGAAEAMASATVDHNAHPRLNARLKGQGYRARARPRTSAPAAHTGQAFSARCPRIAPACCSTAPPAWARRGLRAKSKYKVFWALILAAPDEGRV